MSQVKVDLVESRGWLVVRLPLAEWGQNRGQQDRVQDMTARLDKRRGFSKRSSP